MENQRWEYSPRLNDDNATVSILEAPDWVTLENGTMFGTPPEPGEYDISIRGLREDPYDQTIQEFTLMVGYDDLSPIAAFSTSRHQLTVDFTDRSWGAASWHWDFGDGTISTERNVSHTYASNGSYSVTLSISNDYGEDVLTQTIHVQVGQVGSEEDTDGGPASNGDALNWWALLLIIPIIGCAIGYHRTRNRFFLVAIMLLIIIMAVLLLY
jgi:PKD repeat protein